MKKNNRVLRIGLLALVLTLVTASLVSGTFAKYVTTVSGTGTVKVAHWKADLKKGAAPLTAATQFGLFDTIGHGLDVNQTGAKRVAPGTNGSFELSYDTTDTQVDHTVTLTLTKASGTIPTNMNFTITPTDGFGNTEQTDVQFDNSVSFTKKYTSANGGTGKVIVSWVWAFETTGGDVTDTGEGQSLSEQDLKFDAVFTAEQTNTNGSGT